VIEPSRFRAGGRLMDKGKELRLDCESEGVSCSPWI
jgi:hypothetical protein